MAVLSEFPLGISGIQYETSNSNSLLISSNPNIPKFHRANDLSTVTQVMSQNPNLPLLLPFIVFLVSGEIIQDWKRKKYYYSQT